MKKVILNLVIAITIASQAPVELQSAKAGVATMEFQPKLWVEYDVTAYCPCRKCSGKYGNVTSTGLTAVQGRTVAVDPLIIPYGSQVELEGLGTYVAEDCGAAIKGNKIDVFFEKHSDAVSFGRRKIFANVRRNE